MAGGNTGRVDWSGRGKPDKLTKQQQQVSMPNHSWPSFADSAKGKQLYDNAGALVREGILHYNGGGDKVLSQWINDHVTTETWGGKDAIRQLRSYEAASRAYDAQVKKDEAYWTRWAQQHHIGF